ncbi:hypothetical protein [uncultured Dietzia sp.]|jgi:hypothetical protein|uniref:hypothetical protein n=1 Tax=uncultured Dietzia sp. TaxID=395519 RepID=UPI0026227A73|nr:hypothetical protein [uncultured Dietzia sp.]
MHRVTPAIPPLPGPLDRDALAAAVHAGRPFAARDALDCRVLTRHGLASRFRVLHPGVYIANHARPTTRDRVDAAALWAPADAVLAGWAVAHLHGEKWFSDRECARAIDVYSQRPLRATPGIRVRRTSREVPGVDLRRVAGIPVTSPARAAVDIARWTRGADERVCAVDSVCNSSRTGLDLLAAAAGRMVGQHGVKAATALLPLCDPLADSPQESLLRLSIARSDLPTPTSQLEIYNEYRQKVATADLGYQREMVAIFYDGRHHGRDEQWTYDLQVTAILTDMGWQVVRVARGMSPGIVIHHIRAALERSRLRLGY